MEWRRIILNTFGHRAKKRWWLAAMDIHLVDIGVKSACLFDHWSTDGPTMENALVSLHEHGLITSCIQCVCLGLDITLCSTEFSPESGVANVVNQCHFINVTYTLSEPCLMEEVEVKDTTDTSQTIWVKVKQQTRIRSIIQDLSNQVSVPCLFGLLLGYPCVYWTQPDLPTETCLSCHKLRLFQVKGQLLTNQLVDKDLDNHNLLHICNIPEVTKVLNHSSSGFTSTGIKIFNPDVPVPERETENHSCPSKIHDKETKGGKEFIFLSFSVPDDLCDATLQDSIHNWLTRWKTDKVSNWLQVFSDVWLEESEVTLQDVIL